MARRFNYTGRKAIPQKQIAITLNDGAPRSIGLSWDLTDFHLPEEASVYLEAFSSGSPLVMRFPWGKVAHPSAPPDTRLTDIVGDSIGFNFKVVDENDNVGRLLAISKNIRPRSSESEDGSGKQSLLPVNPVDLQDQVWRLKFAHDRPWLEVNNRIDGIKELARTDDRFFALVYPEVIRRILLQVVILDGIRVFHDLDGDWRVQWLRWAVHWHPDHHAPPETTPEHIDEFSWIEDVVASFCKKHDVIAKFSAPTTE